MTIDLNTIWQFPLRQGNSKDPASGACLLDAVSWFEYGTIGDHPACVCETLAAPGRIINDRLPDNRRQELKPLIEKMIGTADDGFAQQRAEFWAWQAIHVFLPMALDSYGVAVQAEYFRVFKGTLQEASQAAAARFETTAHWAAKAAHRASARSPALTDAADAAESSAKAYDAYSVASRRSRGAACDAAAIAAMFGACAIGGRRETLPHDKIVRANRSFELARNA